MAVAATLAPVPTVMAGVLDAEVKPLDGVDPFDGVEGGWLRVRAAPRRALLRCTRQYSVDRVEYNYLRGGIRSSSNSTSGVALREKPIAPKEHPRFPGLLVDTRHGEVVGEAALDRLWDCRVHDCWWWWWQRQQEQ